MAETNTGVGLDRTLRVSACGTWWAASSGGGHPLGLLQLEPALIADPVARERLATAMTTVRAANPRGVLRTTELVIEARKAWLVVAHLPTPTLAEAIATVTAGAAALTPGARAGLAVDIAAALRDLHAAGLSHGALTANTVVLTAGGAASLVEVGVLAAVAGEPTDIGRDTTAWSALVRELAEAIGTAASPAVSTEAGTEAGPEAGLAARAPAGLAAGAAAGPAAGVTDGVAEAELLRRVADIAASGDLGAAARRLEAEAADLADFLDRESLAAALPGVQAGATAAPPASPRSAPPKNPPLVRSGCGSAVACPWPRCWRRRPRVRPAEEGDGSPCSPRCSCSSPARAPDCTGSCSTRDGGPRRLRRARSVVPGTVVLDPSCPEPSCPEPSCPEPSCPEPSCPEPSCPEPSCPEPSCPEPSCPEPSCPEPSCPEPTCPRCATHAGRPATAPPPPRARRPPRPATADPACARTRSRPRSGRGRGRRSTRPRRDSGSARRRPSGAESATCAVAVGL